MAYQKKCYRSVNSDGRTHQNRGGGYTTRLNSVHRYATQVVETPISPTWVAARAAKMLKV